MCIMQMASSWQHNGFIGQIGQLVVNNLQILSVLVYLQPYEIRHTVPLIVFLVRP